MQVGGALSGALSLLRPPARTPPPPAAPHNTLPHFTPHPYPPMATSNLIAASGGVSPATLVAQLVAFAASVGVAAFLAWFAQ